MDQFGLEQLSRILYDLRDDKIGLLQAIYLIDKIYYLFINAQTHLIVKD